MAWVGFPAQSQMRLFLEYPFVRKLVVMSLKKKITDAVTRDMASPNGLKWQPFVCFSVTIDGETLSSNSLLKQLHRFNGYVALLPLYIHL